MLEQLKTKIEIWGKVLTKYGLNINRQKTEVMGIGKQMNITYLVLIGIRNTIQHIFR